MLVHDNSSSGFGCLVTLASAMSCCVMSSVRSKTRPIADTYKSSAEWCFSTSTWVNHVVAIPMLMRILSNITHSICVRKYVSNWHRSSVSSRATMWVSVIWWIKIEWWGRLSHGDAPPDIPPSTCTLNALPERPISPPKLQNLQQTSLEFHGATLRCLQLQGWQCNKTIEIMDKCQIV